MGGSTRTKVQGTEGQGLKDERQKYKDGLFHPVGFGHQGTEAPEQGIFEALAGDGAWAEEALEIGAMAEAGGGAGERGGEFTRWRELNFTQEIVKDGDDFKKNAVSVGGLLVGDVQGFADVAEEFDFGGDGAEGGEAVITGFQRAGGGGGRAEEKNASGGSDGLLASGEGSDQGVELGGFGGRVEAEADEIEFAGTLRGGELDERSIHGEYCTACCENMTFPMAKITNSALLAGLKPAALIWSSVF